MRTLYVTKGLPASGKSTWARDLLKKEPNRWRRINRDDIRNMLSDGRFSPDAEELVKKVQEDAIRAAFKASYDVVLDNTHLVSSTLRKVHMLAKSIGDVTVMEKGFNVDVQECHRRNQLRQGGARVPDKVIDDMAKSAGLTKGRTLEDKVAYYPPRWAPPVSNGGQEDVVPDASLPKAIICDLDGTLAIMGDRSPYDAANCDTLDAPNVPVIECVKAMRDAGCKIVFMSGRQDKDREASERFISKHLTVMIGMDCGEAEHGVIPHELHMRVTGDQRKDSVVKQELFDAHVRGKYNVVFVLDDRDQVVEFWRSIGLTCMQVAYGSF